MRTHLLGLPVDILTKSETIAIAVRAMRSGLRCQHVALNVAKLVKARRDPELDRDIRDSDVIGIDGMGIAWALRLLGERRATRVAGIDLFESVIAECASEGFRPFLLGASAAVVNDAVRELQRRHPALVIAGSHHGYFSADEERAVCRRIAESSAHCLFVAMPTPRKERFMLRNREQLDVPFVMGIGGSLDVVAGKVRRAPGLVQTLGFEWLYRLAQEPRRLAVRYLRTNAVFAVLLIDEIRLRLMSRVVAEYRSKRLG
jgi:N-acetylglucosaminyldiphosphoundecaprenol N-acetyl-beta-D-mannosaminyltransferase